MKCSYCKKKALFNTCDASDTRCEYHELLRDKKVVLSRLRQLNIRIRQIEKKKGIENDK